MTSSAFAKTFEAVYTVSIHKHAPKSSGIVDKLYEGERVKVQECDDDWCLINHDGPDGWVPVASLERVGGYGGDAPTIVIQGGFNFGGGHKPKPPIVVDPGPHKPPFGQITNVGNLPVSVLDPVTPPNGGGVTPPNGGSNGGPVVCYIGKPCHHPF